MTQSDVETVSIKVVNQRYEETIFKIKRDTKLSKLKGAYASKIGRDLSSLQFLFDGSPIDDDDTPKSLDMDDNDTIDVTIDYSTSSE